MKSSKKQGFSLVLKSPKKRIIATDDVCQTFKMTSYVEFVFNFIKSFTVGSNELNHQNT
jgi:hypothetical protein